MRTAYPLTLTETLKNKITKTHGTCHLHTNLLKSEHHDGKALTLVCWENR